MSIDCTEVEYCKVKVNYTADPQVVSEKKNDVIKQLKAHPVKGFRSGKATDEAIKVQYKKHITEHVKKEMIAQAYEDILYETKMQPIGFPQTLSLNLSGNNFDCELLFLKKPEFELKDVKGLEIPKPSTETTESTAEKMLQELRVAHADSVPFDDGDFIQLKDQITMDCSVSLNDQELEKLSQQGVLYTVGSNYLPEFDDNLLGMVPGEEREFDVLVDGQRAQAKVKFHMGLKTKPCALDDDFAKKLGYETFNELRKAVDGAATNKIKSDESRAISDQVRKQLVSMHDFEVPQWLLTMELQEIAQREKIDLNSASTDVVGLISERAKNNIKFSLILDSIIKTVPEAELSDMEAVQLIKQRLQELNHTNPDAFIMQSQKNGRLFGLIAQIRNEYALQWVVDNVKIIE